MFSFDPRCHGLCGSQKYTSILVGSVASGDGLFSEFCSCYGSDIRTTVPEFEYEAGGEFGVLISVYQIPDNF